MNILSYVKWIIFTIVCIIIWILVSVGTITVSNISTLTIILVWIGIAFLSVAVCTATYLEYKRVSAEITTKYEVADHITDENVAHVAANMINANFMEKPETELEHKQKIIDNYDTRHTPL